MTSKLTKAMAVCLLAATVLASADEWQLSLGASYRTFDDVDFKPFALSSSGGQFVNGYWTSDSDYLVMSDAQIDPTGWVEVEEDLYRRKVTFDAISYAGGSDDMDDSYGAVLALTKQLSTTESGWVISAKISLAGFTTDMSGTASADALSTSTYFGFFQLPVNPGNSIPSAPVMGGSGPALTEPVYDSQEQATTAAMVGMDIDLNLYVLSLGLVAARQFGPLSLSLEAGPSLNVADFDTSVSQTVTWDGGGYSSTAHDDVVDVLFGAYAAGGVAWQLTERVGVSVEARWDEVFSDVETDLAEMDLSGLSFSAMLGFSF
jgi:hypothetical protein